MKEKVSLSELDLTTLLLRIFVRDIKKLYVSNIKYYSYNVHVLLHLPLLVKRWGLLWATSGFPFESYNGVLCTLTHRTKNTGQELVNKLKLALGVECLRNFVRRRKERRLQRSKRGFSSCCDGPVKISLSYELLTLSSELNLSSLPFFQRGRVQSEMFTYSLYAKNKTYVKCLDVNPKPGYAQVIFFIRDSDHVYVVLRFFEVEHFRILIHKVSMLKVNHLQLVP